MAILRLSEVLAYTGYRSHTSIYTSIKRGLFPEKIALGQRSSGWPLNEVEAVVSARVAGLPDDDIKELVAILHEQRKDRFQTLLSAHFTPPPPTPTPTNVVQFAGARA